MKHKQLFIAAVAVTSIAATVAAVETLPVTALFKTERNTVAGLTTQPSENFAGPVIYAGVYYTANENPEEYGIYAIDGATGNMQPVILDTNLNPNAGGVYEDGVYRFVSFPADFEKPVYYEYSVSDWKMLKKEPLTDSSNVALDEATDPETGNIYGCFMDSKGQSVEFGYVDHNTHERTRISSLDVLMFGIFATPEGEIYGIGSDGVLYVFNKETGSHKRVGFLGVQPKYNQTATCDQETGIVYWLGCNSVGATALYTIDTETGKAQAVKSFPNRAGMVGAFIEQSIWKNGAPSSPDNISVTFDKSETTGTISFKIPVTRMDGGSINERMDYSVFINEKRIASGSASSGESVTIPVSVEEGNFCLTVSCRNSEGFGKPARLKSHAGFDAPSNVNNLEATLSGNTATISWDKPTTSLNGGYLDESDISYRLVRYPGGAVISSGYKKTEYKQRLQDSKYAVYRFEVTPQSHKLSGPSSLTEYLAVGPAETIPWCLDTFSASCADVFVTDDNDGWQHSNSAGFTCGHSGKTLVSPSLSLDNSNAYKITVRAASDNNLTDGLLTAKLSRTPDLSAMEDCEFPDMNVNDDGELECYMHPSSTGTWHIGLISGNIQGNEEISIERIEITEGPDAATPERVGNLTVTADEKGANKSVISFDIPRQAINGTATVVNKVNIYRSGNLIGSVDVLPGENRKNFIDNEAPSGHIRYEVRAENSIGEGIPVCSYTYVGIDIPQAPENIMLQDMDGVPRLTWTIPDKGINNAYVNPEELTYTIIRSDNSVAAKGFKGNSFEDPQNFEGNQRFLQYAVAATSEAGTGAYAISDAIVVGTPYQAPIEERFPNGGLDYSFWEQRNNNHGSFALSAGQGWDDEPGCVSFKPKGMNAEAAMVSGKISLDNVAKPTASFRYLATCGANTEIVTSVELPDGREEILDRINFGTLSGNNGWRKNSVDISDYKKYAYVRIKINVISMDGEYGSSLDQIEVTETPDTDLSISISSDRFAKCGEECSVLVSVSNEGAVEIPAGSYDIELFKDNTSVCAKTGPAIAPLSTQDVVMTFTPTLFDDEAVSVYAIVTVDNDRNPDNNTSSEITVNIKHNKLPVPENVSGNLGDDRKATLKWDEPDFRNLTILSTTDGAESYESFLVDNVGEWTLLDLDGAMTFGISDGNGSYRPYPNAITPKSFIIFDTEEAGLDKTDPFGNPAKWGPRTGDKMFVSFQASGMISDDWLISPELSGNEQTVSFWCKSVDVAGKGNESYEFLYSTTDKNPSSFRQLEFNDAVPQQWAEMRYEIPQGSRFFAIRCVSNGKFAFFVDDITFSCEDYTGVKFEGYNVYRDRILLNDKPISQKDFSEIMTQKYSEYQVTAVYDAGESRPGDIVKLGNSGVSDINESNIEVRLYPLALMISGAKGQECAIFRADGCVVYRNGNVTEDNISISLEPGIYIVRAGQTCRKVNISR